MESMDVVAEKSRFLTPCMGNEGFGFGQFQLEMFSQKRSELLLDFLANRDIAWNPVKTSQKK